MTADTQPGRLRRVITQQLEQVVEALNKEPGSERLTRVQFYLSGALAELEQYWDGRGVIPTSARLGT